MPPVDPPPEASTRIQERRESISTVRIALANLRFPASPAESVALAEQAIAQASAAQAAILCFPECFVPGYRAPNKSIPPPDAGFLERASSTIASAAAKSNLTVILGTERLARAGDRPIATALVIRPEGTLAGFQDKVQLDPSEDGLYAPGSARRLFRAGPLTFGIVVCHEGWRYPETVRWAVRHGAQIVFHPHFHGPGNSGYAPSSFADPANSFHEKALLCRAAENDCFIASVNCAVAGSLTTSAIIAPNGSVLAYQPYGVEGLLIADIEPAQATGLLASRYKPIEDKVMPA